MKKMIRSITLFLFILLLGGCAKLSEEQRYRKAQEYYQSALRNFKGGDYGDAASDFEMALKFMDHLTPKQIEKAKFLLGKSYYLDGEYVNAIVALEDFIFYYPKLRATEEAYYLLVDSYIKVSPDPYRDQTYTWKAIEKAREFLSKYPASEYAQRMPDLIDEAYRKIAKHDYLIAKFYEDYGYTYSAAVRYRELMINYSKYIVEEEVAYRYIRSLLMVDRQVRKEVSKIRKLIKETEKKLKSARGEERKPIEKRLNFLKSEIKRWEKIRNKALEEAFEALQKYREVYGMTSYYRELEELAKEKGWKS
jgi:outer membrane protein assembly factor BamD